MNITVYLGSNPGRNPRYRQAAEELGTLIGQGGHTMIYGGADGGLMGLTANAVLAAGGSVVGVIPEFFTFRGHKNLNDLPVLPFRFDREAAYYAPDLYFCSCDNLEFVGIREEGEDFQKLKVYRTFKGNGVITADSLHKTEGSASLHIRYETENSLYGFEPDLTYKSIMAPLVIRGKRKLLVDIFNPDTVRKALRIEGFGEQEIKQQLNWQTLIFTYEDEGEITLESLKFTVEDQSKNGEIYVDNIRFE